MMCARMLKGGAAKKTRLEEWMNGFLGGIIDSYGKTLRRMLEKPLISIFAWIVCVLGTVFFFAILPKSFLPEGDSGIISGAMLAPLGSSTRQMKDFQDQLNAIVLKDPNVDALITVTGMNPGADQSTGVFHIRLKEAKHRKPMDKVVPEIRAKLAHITRGFSFLRPIPTLKISVGGESTASGSKYSYMMVGDDQGKLYGAALELEREMRQIPGFVDVQNSVRLDMPQLDVTLLRDRASTFGLTAQDINTALMLAYAGGKVTIYKTDIDQYEIIEELDKSFQEGPEDLSQIYLKSSLNGGLVPFGSIAVWKESVGPQNVPHYDQMNSATISFNIQPGVPLGTATTALEKTAASVVPPGVTGKLQGEAEQFEEAIASLGVLIIIAVFIKYIVLGILYESYLHPVTILSTLPVGTLGGLVTLFIFGSELSLYAYVGVFMLLGIVAKNGIMMVEFANQLIEEGHSDLEAIHKASIVRFRPILMTGLAAIMGAMPIALGYGADGSSRMPLGLIVVGGLVFSQVITLFVTPGLFLYMQKLQRAVLDKFELTRAGSSRAKE
jgi:HAE1 family hydrophobic/amphiphilic exporter-1